MIPTMFITACFIHTHYCMPVRRREPTFEVCERELTKKVSELRDLGFRVSMRFCLME